MKFIWKFIAKNKPLLCVKLNYNNGNYILRMLSRTFIREDFEEIQLLLKERTFDWKDLLTEEEYDVASVKKYFSEIAKNDAW